MKLIAKTLLIFFLGAWQFAPAQENVDTAIVNRIRKEAFHHSQIPHIAHYLTEVSGPRLSNSPGFRRASTWAVDEFKRWGLANAKLEAYGEFGKGWEIEKSYVALTKPYYQTMIAYPKAWCGNTNGLVKAPLFVIDVNDSTAIDKNFESLKNKIVFFKGSDTLLHSLPFKPVAARYSDSAINKIKDPFMMKREFIILINKWIASQRKRMEKLKKAGALAVLVRAPGGDGVSFVDGQYNTEKTWPQPFPKLQSLPKTI